ncbi:SIS domain-containing protein [Testudinibacter sp. TR-2022]|uniref:SIS domain-containing protein n=1 Tax=Testudinibacter sp. TR-2022 TaxID=2585029 RepID=UPI001118D1AB|nr:SIS domain-containing protein [Testudinibacter sp. TR-2022]TNH03882.1 SIS domain-containing protein [Pasteurellaceae bacterium Phil31]TNH07678.1 SIS domain-containing protein [Testudinibacter sp. TR-2022]TNH08772.1 SIS domain-containing protein [Testudinibacter sp. TR-2022]TNH10784.1 SIS domain-containing protein [Testudinibacter sp. TR-2022]TNH18374.1 SIS domain-containing protein [Testudinibacter sp. TR-2022]
MGFLNKIEHLLGSYSKTELKIAEFILQHSLQVKNLSSSKLAETIGVSQSAIIKFSQKLGLRSYTEFRVAISEDLALNGKIKLHDDIGLDDSLATVAEKLFQEKQQALQETYRINSLGVLQQVLTLLNRAKKILLIGIGNSALVAKDFAYKLNKISITALTEMDTHAQLVLSQTLTAEDLLFVISFSGQKKELLLAVETAKAQNVPVVALTSASFNPLHQAADQLLFSIADESLYRSSSIASRTAQHAITDLLFMGLLQQNQQTALAQIERSKQLIARL